jgi:hypothetical protein
MAKRIGLGDQAAELCIQIRQAVEGWWLYEGLATYVVVRNNQKRAKRFSNAYTAIWVSAFDTVVVCSYNLAVTQKTESPLTLETFADELDLAGEGKLLAVRLRAMRQRHAGFIKSLTRIRNKTTAHVDRSMTTNDQFTAARLANADIRNFLQDLVYIFDEIARFSSKDVGAPNPQVRHEMMQMLHLAIRSSEEMQAKHQIELDKLHT